MASVNIVALTGRLTKKVEPVSYGNEGGTKLEFSMAVDVRRKGPDGQWTNDADYFDVEYFGKDARSLSAYMDKGRAVGVQGRLKQDRWKDRQTGQNRSAVKVAASSVVLLGSRPGGGDTPSGGQQPKVYQTYGQARKSSSGETGRAPQDAQPVLDSFEGDVVPF